MSKYVTILILSIALLLAAPAAAQAQDFAATQAARDALPLIAAPDIEIREVSVEATAEPDGGVTINIEAPATPAMEVEPPSANGDVTMNVWQVVIGVGTLLITGMAAGGFGVLAFLRGVNQNPALMASIEALANSRPDNERTTAYQIGKVLKEAGTAIEEATDNIPVASKGATVVNAPAGSTTVISPPAPTAFADPRPTEQGAAPSHPIPQSPQQPSPEAVRQFTQGDITPAVTPEGETVG